MSEKKTPANMSRRDFLKAGVAASAVVGLGAAPRLVPKVYRRPRETKKMIVLGLDGMDPVPRTRPAKPVLACPDAAGQPAMTDVAPSLDDLERLAREAWAALPEALRRLAGDVIFRIEDFADDELLADLELEDPFELTGLYVGVDLTQRSMMDPAPQAPIVHAFEQESSLPDWSIAVPVIGIVVIFDQRYDRPPSALSLSQLLSRSKPPQPHTNRSLEWARGQHLPVVVAALGYDDTADSVREFRDRHSLGAEIPVLFGPALADTSQRVKRTSMQI